MEEIAPLIQSFIKNELQQDVQALAQTDSKETFRLLRLALIAAVRELVKNNMEKLVGILYRIDVSEAKLQHALAERGSVLPEEVIADLIIDRQVQKLRTRKSFEQEGDGEWDFEI